MNAREAQDGFIKWAVPTLLAALVYTAVDLKSEFVGMRRDQINTEARVDRVATAIKEDRKDADQMKDVNGKQDVSIGQLQVKVFGQPIQN